MARNDKNFKKAVETLIELASNDTIDPAVRLAAAEAILKYAQ